MDHKELYDSKIPSASRKYSVSTGLGTSKGTGDGSTSGGDLTDDQESERLTKETEDEGRRLFTEIEMTVKEVNESKFYEKLVDQMETSASFQYELKRVLGSHSQLLMVIYALGSLEFSYTSHYQLAIAILLQRNFSNWIGGIEVFDPKFSPADLLVLKNLGCDIISTNEGCRRKVEEPTLFFMPYASYDLLGNLLGTNWCPSQMNQMIVLTSGFSRILSRIKTLHFNESKLYIEAILNYTNEMIVRANFGDRHTSIFWGFAWHSFYVDSDFDMETLLSGKLSSELRLKKLKEYGNLDYHDFQQIRTLQEEAFTNTFSLVAQGLKNIDWTKIYGKYRGPRKYRSVSMPPPSQWIKLNIAGKKSDGDLPGGFGGICRKELEDPLFSYHGSLDNVDELVACLEALRHGLIKLIQLCSHGNLIVEGDNITIIRWLNKRPEPPERIEKYLNDIFGLLVNFNNTVIYHIYEEANSVAKSLAEKGAKLDKARGETS